MIVVLLERHHDASNQAYSLLHKFRNDRKLTEYNCVDYLKNIDYEHPEQQIKLLENIVSRFNYPEISTPHVTPSSAHHALIVTASLVVVYWFNNQLIHNPNLNLEAYEIVLADSTKDTPARIKPAMVNNWIDETITSHVYEKLNRKLNALSANKNGI